MGKSSVCQEATHTNAPLLPSYNMPVPHTHTERTFTHREAHAPTHTAHRHTLTHTDTHSHTQAHPLTHTHTHTHPIHTCTHIHWLDWHTHIHTQLHTSTDKPVNVDHNMYSTSCKHVCICVVRIQVAVPFFCSPASGSTSQCPVPKQDTVCLGSVCTRPTPPLGQLTDPPYKVLIFVLPNTTGIA